MYKVTLCSEAGLNAEMPPNPDAPKFADPQPQVFPAECTRENAIAAINWFFDNMELEELESEEKQDAA